MAFIYLGQWKKITVKNIVFIFKNTDSFVFVSF